MSEIKEILTFLSAIVTLITGVICYMKLAWVKNLFRKILGFFSYICKFFKWLSRVYFKFIWKIIGIEKWFKEENKKLPLEIDMELQKAINATFSDEQKKQTFINNYIWGINKINEDDPHTLSILEKFWKKSEATEFIKYLEGFFEALSYWSEEKTYTWTLLSTKRKEAELSECMKHINSGKLEEFQIKCARFQSVIPETVFFLDPENYIT